MQDIQSQIIRRIMHEPGLHFNELWDKSIASNKFAYHLKTLEDSGFVEKREEGYFLTQEGRKHVAFIDGDSGKAHKSPLLVVVVVIVDNGRVLLSQRKKEPFYSYWGFVGGKVEFSEYVLEAASHELKQETGLEADLYLKGLFCSKTFSKNEQSFSHYIFIVKGENPKGDFIAKTREGESAWVEIKDMNKLHLFPDVPRVLDIAVNANFSLLEMDRYEEDGEFKRFGNIKETRF